VLGATFGTFWTDRAGEPWNKMLFNNRPNHLFQAKKNVFKGGQCRNTRTRLATSRAWRCYQQCGLQLDGVDTSKSSYFTMLQASIGSTPTNSPHEPLVKESCHLHHSKTTSVLLPLLSPPEGKTQLHCKFTEETLHYGHKGINLKKAPPL
jgi:hypothetical protein